MAIKRKIIFWAVIVPALIFAAGVLWTERNLGRILTFYRQDLERAISRRVKYDVFISRVEARLFPTVEVVLHDIGLRGRAGCPSPVRVRKVFMNIDTPSLFGEKPRIEELRVDGLEIDLFKMERESGLDWGADRACRENVASQSDEQVSPRVMDAESPAKSKIAQLQFALDDVKAAHAQVTLRTEKGKVKFVRGYFFSEIYTRGDDVVLENPVLKAQLDGMNDALVLQAGAINLGPGSADVIEGAAQLGNQRFSIEGRVHGPEEGKRLTVKGEQVDLGRLSAFARQLGAEVPDSGGVVERVSVELLGWNEQVEIVSSAAARNVELAEGSFASDKLILKRLHLIRPADGPWSAQVQASCADSALRLPGGAMQAGGIYFDGEFRRGESIEVTGSLSLSRYAAMKGAASVSTLNLTGLRIAKEAGGAVRGASNILVSDLKVAYEGSSYSAKKVQGRFSIRHPVTSEGEISSSLDVVGFSYNDDVTAIRNVDAALPDIRTKIASNGNVSAAVKVQGRSIQLAAPGIRIQSAERVDAMLRIEVPAKGGYSVSGPVGVKNAEIQPAERQFSRVAADVQMLVSGPLKEFSSPNMRFVYRGQKGSLNTVFRMISSAYELDQTELRMGGSSIAKVSGRLGRREVGEYKLSAALSDFEAAALMALAFPGDKEEYGGVLENFEGGISGDRRDFVGSMNGSGKFVFREKLFKRYDFSRELGRALNQVPVIGDVISPLPAEGDSRKATVSGDFVIADRKINLADIKLERANYRLTGKGSMSFDFEVDLDASVVFLQETVGRFALGVGVLQRLFGRIGRIVVPVFIRGKVPQVRVIPDIATFLRDNSGLSMAESVTGAAGKGVKSAVDGIFGGGNEKARPEMGSAGTPAAR